MNTTQYLTNTVVISLASRLDRRTRVQAMLQAERIVFRFQNALENRTNPRLGCSQSHAMALTDFLAGEETYLCLLEDDCVLATDFRARFDALDLTSRTWDTLRLGGLHLERPVPVAAGTCYATNILDMHAVVYTRWGAEKTLRAFKQGMAEEPGQGCDVWIAQATGTLALFPNLAWQAHSPSNITGREYSNYDTEGRQGWALEAVAGQQ